jgi:hypothetical protein
MLGGNDVVSLRPVVEVPVLARRNGVVRMLGRYNSMSIDRQPKYAETVLQLGFDLTPNLRLDADSRWAKYDDPVLQLRSGYLSHFQELTYRFAPNIQVALGFGVDPWVIDPPVNQYAPIGRDLFLFARGANGAVAEQNYLSLGQAIAAAERALEDERRVQLEAIIHF